MTAPLSPLTDAHGRTVRYLRLSVTDRCNLRCIYCRSTARERHIPHDEILRYEECLRIAETTTHRGIEKIRLTGGEPFVRKGFIKFLRMLRERLPGTDLRITTNGTLLGGYIGELKQLGLGAVNFSLDSLRPETFFAVTGSDLLPMVLRNLEALLEAEIRVKINAVALRGHIEQDIPLFLDFIRSRPVDVRFIEFMPMGSDTRWSAEHFISADELLAEIRKQAELAPLGPDNGQGQKTFETGRGLLRREPSFNDGPARMYAVKDALGRFGLITPMSNHFCAHSNRLRVTSD